MKVKRVEIKKEMTVCCDCVKKHSVTVYGEIIKMGNCKLCHLMTMCKIVCEDQVVYETIYTVKGV